MRRSLPFLLLALAGVVHAQDARQVSEPVVPAACAVLTANPDKPGRDDTARIQAAIDACAPGRAVLLAKSNEKTSFTSGPLRIKGGVTLMVDAGTTLFASTSPAAYERGTGASLACGTIDQKGRACKPFITIEGAQGGGIMGRGTIDGRGGALMDGKDETWWQLARRAQREEGHQNVPRLIEVLDSKDITLYGITLKNSANFHVTLNRVDGFTAWGVKIDTPANARNTDGIDPISSRNVTIAHSWIRTGDDNIAIKAGGSGLTENISVLHNHFFNGHGMSIGSETNGGVRNVLVRDLSMDGATSGLRIKSDISRGGLVENVRYEDVCLRNIKAPLDIDTRYTKNAKGELRPQYRGIRLVNVHSTTPGKLVARGIDAAHALDITVERSSVHPGSEWLVEHAAFYGQQPADLMKAAADCAGRFADFPVEAVKSTRPQLTDEQAKAFSIEEVMKTVGRAGAERTDPWNPLADPLANGAVFTPDYVVDAKVAADGKMQFSSVQAAVNRAVIDAAGSPKKRLYILVKPGVYRELLYVPASAVPITIYSLEADATRTKITASLDAALTAEEYVRRHGAQFDGLHESIRAMHEAIRARTTISTSGSMTVWVKNDGFQARNITFENGYNKETGNARSECGERDCGPASIHAQMNIVHHQALALQVEGADKVLFENLHLIGFQDTLFLKSAEPRVTVRSFFHRSYIEGDVDFIFGDTTAYFYRSEIKSLGDRSTSYVGAPNTNYKTKYGFVFNECRFTNDGRAHALEGKFYLLRQWFFNQRCTVYGSVPLDGYACTLGEVSQFSAPKGTITKTVLETVGKMVILNSRIGGHINKTHPWADWNKNGTLPYRPVQYSSDDFWNKLRGAGLDPEKTLGYGPQPQPADIYLGEFNNVHE